MNYFDENILLTKKHYLILIEEQIETNKQIKLNEFDKFDEIDVIDKFDKFDEIDKIDEINYLKNNFCGNVINDLKSIDLINFNNETNIFICGDIDKNIKIILCKNITYKNIYIIDKFSYNYDQIAKTNLNVKKIKLGMIPINIHNIGVYFRDCYDSNTDWFVSINNEHKFQSLTESNKQSSAFRTGIYLTPIEKISLNNDENCLKFNLMRSSTNFKGPTDNFRNSDITVVSEANIILQDYFHYFFELNHVQAQIYHNISSNTINHVNLTETKSEKKGRIKAHSDKTEDMDQHGIIVFCSFYENYINNRFIDKNKKISRSKMNYFDFTYGKNVSVLSSLRFKLKKDVIDQKLIKSFDLILYPNSMFAISLDTNRLYTHEIIPSNLFVDKIPTRMGYVIRCSKTKAIHINNNTHISSKNIDNLHEFIKLVEPDEESIDKLKNLYLKENVESKKIIYDQYNFSLNNGDYQKPHL